MDCPFCDIVAGEAAAHEVHRGEDTVAFLDINPAAPGHTLVVPRPHREALFDLADAEVGALFRMARDVGAAQRRALDAEGVNVFQSNGAAAGQDVFHVHAHVVPRQEDDDIRFAPSRGSLTEADGTELAAAIADEL